jgi:serine/threonine-protein kinase
MANVAAESLVGTTLGSKYAIEAFIGMGATGSVYRARQTILQRTVAIKVLHRHLALQPALVERFQREAYSASRLDHPNSLRVLDFGQSDGQLYLVMEYVEGRDLLNEMQREWPFGDARIVDIMSQTLAALATAHDLGIVHRDLKPENILLLHGTDDEGKPVDVVKVCDFGIAKLTGAYAEKSQTFSRHLTTAGFVIGTPDYMSPEQARGEEIDGRSDLYSLGVVLYHLLAGQLPFPADTPLGVVVRHISDPPPPPSTHRSVDPRLEAICLKALRKDPRERYQHARDMRRALRAALAGADEPATVSPRGSSTDMTSVPLTRPAPPMPRWHAWPALRNFRAPLTQGRRAAAVLATAVGFAGSLVVMRWLSARGPNAPVVATAGESVLATPSPPIADTALAPVVPATATADDLAPVARRTPDPPEKSPERSRAEKPSARSGGGASTASTANAGSTASAASDTSATAAPTRSNEPVALPPAPATSEATVAPAPVAPVVPVAASPAAPNAPAVDPTRAAVAVGAIATTGGISSGKVRTALARVPFTTCYRRALVNRTTAAPLEASLQLKIDLSGRVTGASLSQDGSLPGLRSCIESEARGISIRDVDTGDGTAVITLVFSPR